MAAAAALKIHQRAWLTLARLALSSMGDCKEQEHCKSKVCFLAGKMSLTVSMMQSTQTQGNKLSWCLPASQERVGLRSLQIQ